MSRAFPAVLVVVGALVIGLGGCGASPGYESADAKGLATHAPEASRGLVGGRRDAGPSGMDPGPHDELWILARPERAERTPRTDDEQHGLLCRIEDREVPLPLEETRVRGRVTGFVSSVTLTQRYRNPAPEPIEAVYVFPLPPDAAVREFVLEVGERRIRGVVRPREEAKELYEAARAQGQVASLLEQQRPNIFSQKVANLAPGLAIDIRLSWLSVLPYRDGRWQFRFPMTIGPRYRPAPRASEGEIVANDGWQSRPLPEMKWFREGAPEPRMDFELEVDAGVPLRDLRCPTHDASIEHPERGRAVVAWSNAHGRADRDLVVSWSTEGDRPGADLILEPDAEGGTWMLLLHPPASLAALKEREALEYVFVVDTSGSMRGRPMKQTREAMLAAIERLDADDRFQIVRFSSDAGTFADAPVAATRFEKGRAARYVRGLRAQGGTEMMKGLRTALEQPREGGRARYLAFMTDGFIGNEADVLSEIGRSSGGDRILSFGVGSSPNAFLLDRMARLGRGAVAWLGPEADGEEIMLDFYRRTRTPALTGIRLDAGGTELLAQTPARAPDLLVGRPVALFGRWRGTAPRSMTIRGRVGRREMSIEVLGRRMSDGLSARPDQALATLWARRRLSEYLDAGMVHGDRSGELERAGATLALRHGLMSPWTSFLAIDALTRADRPARHSVTVPLAVPAGVHRDAVLPTGSRER